MYYIIIFILIFIIFVLVTISRAKNHTPIYKTTIEKEIISLPSGSSKNIIELFTNFAYFKNWLPKQNLIINKLSDNKAIIKMNNSKWLVNTDTLNQILKWECLDDNNPMENWQIIFFKHANSKIEIIFILKNKYPSLINVILRNDSNRHNFNLVKSLILKFCNDNWSI